MDFKQYGILPEKGRFYENIAYVMALTYNACEKRVDKLLRKYNLSTAQFNVLMTLFHKQKSEGKIEGITQVEISKSLIVSAGSITRLIEKLSKSDYLSATQNKKNRRQNVVFLTKKGFDAIENIWPEYNALLQELVNKIPNHKQALLAEILADWFKSLNEE